jgi:hypothetical protein
MTQDTPLSSSSGSSDSEPFGDRLDLSRRQVLLTGGVGLAVAGLGATAAASPPAATGGTTPDAGADTTTPGTCYTLASEAIDGPYYLDYDLFRRNLVEDRTGIPLTLQLTFIDVVTCKPLRGAAVDIWSCDGTGVYSGYIAAGNNAPSSGGVHTRRWPRCGR